MKKLSILFLVFASPLLIFAQQITSPNFALASHPMKVVKIETINNQTVIELSIENQSESGTFCADKNIYIQDLKNNKKYKLIKSSGIPVCPANYIFTFVGEVLTFQLFFPKLSADVKYINLVEDCDQYCFSIKGIVFNEEMNKDINLGYEYYYQGKLDFALHAFKLSVENNTDYPFALNHFNIIQILAEKYDFESAKKWYHKIVNSNFQDKDELISRLKAQPYYQNLIQ